MKHIYGDGDGSYLAAGGLDGITALVNDFYHFMESLELAKDILAMHDRDLTLSKKKLTYFLSGWLGGPRVYQEHFGEIRIPMAHRHLTIGRQERDAWLHCMAKAIDQQPWDSDFKVYLLQQLSIPAERCRNSE